MMANAQDPLRRMDVAIVNKMQKSGRAGEERTFRRGIFPEWREIGFQLTWFAKESIEAALSRLAPSQTGGIHPLLSARKQHTDMATTNQRNKNMTRPTKSGGAKRKRQNDQKKRLIALGMDEAVVALMNPRDVRTKLKHPAKVAKECAAKDA
ncbi:hypothetical protein ACFQY0_11935 [Haloferula chungangensis]|uniref:Uncharacterized protein n=1 Tax=Haloferula chungangensis TaxID=1048331 RepID=A0ABW2L681_9BACT